MTIRYYIFSRRLDAINFENNLHEEGRRVHKTDDNLGRHYHINGFKIYIDPNIKDEIVKCIVEFPDDEGDMNQLEKIAKKLNASQVVDTFLNKVF
ncbi:MAG: hypothetical protein V1645_03350 [archaeon]